MTEPQRGSRDLDAVRERLRRRGYLGGRVERYLVKDALHAEHPGKRRLRVAAKGALLVGPLAALWTAGVTLASDPRSFAASESLLLWAYDFLFAAPFLGVLFLVTSFVVPALRKTGWSVLPLYSISNQTGQVK